MHRRRTLEKIFAVVVPDFVTAYRNRSTWSFRRRNFMHFNIHHAVHDIVGGVVFRMVFQFNAIRNLFVIFVVLGQIAESIDLPYLLRRYVRFFSVSLENNLRVRIGRDCAPINHRIHVIRNRPDILQRIRNQIDVFNRVVRNGLHDDGGLVVRNQVIAIGRQLLNSILSGTEHKRNLALPIGAKNTDFLDDFSAFVQNLESRANDGHLLVARLMVEDHHFRAV